MKEISKLRSFIENRDFAGYDPYDALNSPLVRLLTLNTKIGRICWTQFFRRSPVNLRPLLGIAKGHNPKALGLFLEGYAKLYGISADESLLPLVDRLLYLLEQTRSRGGSGNAWGYNFDWQSRAAFVPAYTPTIVNTAFIGHALLTCYRHTGKNLALELAKSIPEFMRNDLNRKQESDTFCFSYTPQDHNYVHNANMLGASLLIRLSHRLGDAKLCDPALASLAYSMNCQHADGSWYYAETPYQKWIDSFHTGFNLEALRHFLWLQEARQYREAYEKGVEYYANNFFLEDGTPKYYNNSVYPIDIHCPTQAVSFFSAEGDSYSELTGRVHDWLLGNMWDNQGYFYFRKGRLLTNKIPYIRWAEAWGFRALTEYYFQNGTCGEC